MASSISFTEGLFRGKPGMLFAISGGTRTGKTTLANQLASKYSAEVISIGPVYNFLGALIVRYNRPLDIAAKGSTVNFLGELLRSGGVGQNVLIHSFTQWFNALQQSKEPFDAIRVLSLKRLGGQAAPVTREFVKRYVTEQARFLRAIGKPVIVEGLEAVHFFPYADVRIELTATIDARLERSMSPFLYQPNWGKMYSTLGDKLEIRDRQEARHVGEIHLHVQEFDTTVISIGEMGQIANEQFIKKTVEAPKPSQIIVI